MRTRIVALLMMCTTPAFGEVTPAQMAQYLKDPPSSWWKEQAEVFSLVRASAADLSLQTPAKRLAGRWHIPEDAASNLIHALVIKADRQIAQEGLLEHMDAAERLAPESDEIWNVVAHYRIGESGCSDELRAKYLDKSSGNRTTSLLEQCENWVPEFYRRHPDDLPARFMIVDIMERDDVPAALAVSRTLLDTLEASTGTVRPAVRDSALFRYWALLGQAGLGTVLLADADARPRDQLLAMFDAEMRPVVIDGFQIGGDGHEQDRRDHARTAWLLALIAAGRLDEARVLDAKYGSRLTHDILRGSPAPQRDLFDDYAGDGKTSGLLEVAEDEGPMAMRLSAKFLSANQFDSGGRYLLRHLCDVSHRKSLMPSPEKLTDAYRAHRERYSSLIATRRTADGCAPAATGVGDAVSARLGRLPETPLTEQEKALSVRARLTDELSLPQGFEVVRAERDDNRVTVVCISRAVDPGGPVIPGGYWLMRSKNGGRTWQTPLYLGFQKFEPYVVLPEGRLPMLQGNNLRLEVDVEELDPESITFPPIRLRARRQARDLYVTLPLSALRRDRDHDGFTDILEARLNTDPDNRDTDGDGISDRRDDFPHVSARGKPHALAPIVIDLLDKLADHEGTDDEEDEEDDLARRNRRRANPDSFLFTFIEGDPDLFHGLHFDGHVIVLSDAQVRESAARFGPTFPIAFPDILLAPDGKRALVRWNAGWVGGAYRYDKVDEEWVAEEVDDWITRGGAPIFHRGTVTDPHVRCAEGNGLSAGLLREPPLFASISRRAHFSGAYR
jgi:hypothetical protein